jgi:hypothetical protein
MFYRIGYGSHQPMLGSVKMLNIVNFWQKKVFLNSARPRGFRKLRDIFETNAGGVFEWAILKCKTRTEVKQKSKL